jgi:eukaryotic-like serine/threonine-protein kinase
VRARELEAFLELPEIREAGARKAVFRQTIATLARAGTTFGPSALDGMSPVALARAVAIAIKNKFFDDVDWLSRDALAVALYELANALPNGPEKRDLGRRVLSFLTEGTARVFIAIATRMARSSRKGLFGPAVRARVSLVFSAPAAILDVGPLAFAMVSRRELAREWIVSASTGPLPARRLAARILERAALIAARRAHEGDDYAPRVFTTEHVARAFERLLADREPLVWRHAAVARGLLAGVASTPWKAVNEYLHPRLGATEWRRGAVSMVAAIGTAPDRALPRAHEIIRSAMASQDRGLVATMVHGLPRALETEPEAAEQLLDAIVDADAAGAAESVASVMRELTGDAGRRAVATARAVLADRLAHGIEDPAEFMLARALSDELDPDRTGDPSLRDSVAHAIHLFVDKSARDAYNAAIDALEIARIGMSTLEGLEVANDQRGIAMRTSVLLLRDIDLGLLEEPALGHLLHLGGKSEDADQALDDLHDRLGRWLIGHEQMVPPRDPSALGMSGRRLRALLHLLDTEGGETGDDDMTSRAHQRRVEAASFLFDRLGSDPHSPLHRTISATLARALDALVREGTCEPVDVLLVAASRIGEPADIATLAEASMNPDVEGALHAWARFMRVATSDDEAEAAKIEGLFELGAALGDDGSGRAEGLRTVLVRIAQSLRQLSQLSARRDLEAAASAFDTLAGAAHAWMQVEAGALRRVLAADADAPPVSTVAVAQAGRLSGHLLRIGEAAPNDARAAAAEGIAELNQLLPPAVMTVIGEVLTRVSELPFDPENAPVLNAQAFRPMTESLPAWLGPRRTIGGFYVVRPLGAGAAASVFVAKRIEERHDHAAEQFALKVPDYDGAAARALSEQEFLAFFRAEATALLGLPSDENLARFVTFDLAARPKPILVMELIEGPTLERFIGASESASKIPAARAFDILDGVAAGLEVMHRHAIGHLDLKPSNVILRQGRTPTLVDFGLAGRVIRPGCATGPYGAPEVWGVTPDGFRGEPSPMAADVYAFGALAFEVLTGRTLFDADSEIAIVSKHLVHDGHPAELDYLSHVRPLVELLEHTLRRDPRQRWSISQVRTALQAIAKIAGAFPWPLVAA